MLKWIFERVIELYKKSYPLVRLGSNLLIKAPLIIAGSGWVFALIIPDGYMINSLEITTSGISILSAAMAIIAFIMGLILIWLGIKAHNSVRHTAKVLIVSILGSTARFPDEILYESEKVDSKETVELGQCDENNDPNESIRIFNSEKKVDIYGRFILNNDCKKVLLGGRARIPFLVAYGSCFRGASNIVYFDQTHRDSKWKLLDDMDENINITTSPIDELRSSNNGDIGIAVSFTSQITKEQLPPFIKEHVLYISPDIQYGKNLFKNKDNLQRVTHEIQSVIDKLTVLTQYKRLHLFLSVQTSVALDLGRKYQEGMHKDWIIHNFDGSSGKYKWAIRLSNGYLSEYDSTVSEI